MKGVIVLQIFKALSLEWIGLETFPNILQIISSNNFIAFVGIVIAILAIWWTHIIAEKYTAHKKYIEWLHDLNQRYYLKMADYMDNLSKTLERYRYTFETFAKHEEILKWSFYLICSFMKMFRELNDEVGDLRLFDYQKSHVDGILIRKLNNYLIEHFKEFLDVKYVEEKVKKYYFEKYTKFKSLVNNDRNLHDGFENFKRWIEDYNNLNTLIELSRLYSDSLMIAIMQTYPLSNPLSLVGFSRWIKSKIYRKDVSIERVIGVNPRNTIKKAKNLVERLECQEKLLKDTVILLNNLNSNHIETSEMITMLEINKLLKYKDQRMRRYLFNISRYSPLTRQKHFRKMLNKLFKLGYIEPKKKPSKYSRYELEHQEDVSKALNNTVKLYLKIFNQNRLKRSCDLRCFWCYGMNYQIYVAQEESENPINRLIENPETIDLNDLIDLNIDTLIEIVKKIENEGRDRSILLQDSDGKAGLVLCSYLVYSIGFRKEDAIEHVIKSGFNPFYKDDIQKTIKILNEFESKRLEKIIPM